MAAQVTQLVESRWDWQYDVTLVLIIFQQVLMVTGGYGDGHLDSTEILRPGSGWQEITSARIPRLVDGLRVSTVDNRVLLFGK